MCDPIAIGLESGRGRRNRVRRRDVGSLRCTNDFQASILVLRLVGVGTTFRISIPI